jgi:hypothetical protein
MNHRFLLMESSLNEKWQYLIDELNLFCEMKIINGNPKHIVLPKHLAIGSKKVGVSHAIRNEVSEEGAKKGRKPRETGKDDRDVLS